MLDPEFEYQVFQTPTQWKAGVTFGLSLGESGLSLFETPSFLSWVSRAAAFGDSAIDRCGQTWWVAYDQTDKKWFLFRIDSKIPEVERVVELPIFRDSRCDSRAEDPEKQTVKIWITPDYLLIYEGANLAGRHAPRVLGLSWENYQIVFEIPLPDGLIDLDLDRGRRFRALLRGENNFYFLQDLPLPPGRPSEPQPLPDLQRPVALAVSPEGCVYVLETKTGHSGFLRICPNSDQSQPCTEPVFLVPTAEAPSLENLEPAFFKIDARGVLYLASKSPFGPGLYQWAPDGSYLGAVVLPPEINSVSGAGFGPKTLNLTTNRGLAHFRLDGGAMSASGEYLAPALDNGELDGTWHRLVFTGLFPENSVVEVSYHASNDVALKAAHDKIVRDKCSAESRKRRIDSLLSPHWKTEQFKGGSASESTAACASARHDMAFIKNTGRYLYLRFRLLAFDARGRPLLSSARIVHPRKSYLRYLPDEYSEDPTSKDFLDRFLTLFETVFEGLEKETGALFRYFDAGRTRSDFLPWLASWIGLAIDEQLPVARRRELLAAAPDLFARKGTPWALSRLLEIYTGKSVTILEHSRLRPLILGTKFRLGSNHVLASRKPELPRIGDSTVVGELRLPHDASASSPGSLLPNVHTFSIVLDLDPKEFAARVNVLRQLVEEHKPAQTLCFLRLAGRRNETGAARLGIDSVVTDTHPYRLGVSPLGEATLLAKSPRAPRVGRTARLGMIDPL